MEDRLHTRLEEADRREDGARLAASKCNDTLSSLEKDAAEVEALKQGLDRRLRQAEKDAQALAASERELARSTENVEERERHLSEREAEHAGALAALENSRKALEGAATFAQGKRDAARRALKEVVLSDRPPEKHRVASTLLVGLTTPPGRQVPLYTADVFFNTIRVCGIGGPGALGCRRRSIASNSSPRLFAAARRPRTLPRSPERLLSISPNWLR